MKVLVACEFSGIVRDAFKARGHDAWSSDLLPTEREGQHIQGDVITYLMDSMENERIYGTPFFDLIIAHVPCTYLCNSGVRWLFEKRGRVEKMVDAGRFFKSILNCKAERICIENPIPHKYAIDIIGRKYDQIIQPWQFGHGETKATCLWLKNLPKLKPTNIVEGREQRIWKMARTPDRGKLRSVTFQGIADAMAEQWG